MSSQFSKWAVAALSLVSTLAFADVYVISNSGAQLAPTDVRDVFIGEKQFAGSVKLIPVDNGALQEKFLDAVMKMDASRYSTVWTKKSFREGINPPPVKSGDAEVTDFVKKTPGAVGYVSSQPSGVNVIHKY
ncbi:MAG TPA: phosphate ABC transporter substrate-binding protein [Rhodocyclaceae bacterium]